MGPIDPAEAAAGRQSYETYMRVREEYPGITPEGAALVRSLQEVNWGFKWINQFYMGDLAETRQQLTRVPPGSIPLYRAVTDAELAHIQAKNSIGPSPSGLEVKYFSSTPEGASLYAKQAYSRWPQEGPYTLIRTSIPNGLIPPEMAAPYLDRGVPTITVPNAFLPQLARPEILPYMIVPPTLPP